MNQNYDISGTRKSASAQLLRNTYLLLGLSLIPTVIGAMFGVSFNFSFLRTSPILGTIVLIVAMYGLMFMVERNKYNFSGIVWLMIFTLFMGVLLGPLLQFALKVKNGNNIVALAGLLTATTFIALSILSSFIKRELTGLSNFLFIGMIVIIVAMVVNIFLKLPMLYLVICGAMVIFSSLLILMQLNRIISGGETSYISATLTLFVGIYNLFTSLLQIILAFSGGNNNK